MKIGIISGSNRTGRKSHLVAQYLQQLADGHKAVTESVLLDIHAYNFPVLEERYGRLANPPVGLEEFHQHLIIAMRSSLLRLNIMGEWPAA
jgi:NAD(P)H-dependent FMN reductase